jgi:cobalt/nickel transport system ATP-binding protein
MMPLIALDEVTVARSGKIILDRVSLSLQAGERLALVGRNGAGKTTLLRSLVGLEKPQSGTIFAFGAACRHEKDFRPVRRRVAYLFQDPDDQLFCPTVLDDVAFGPLNLGLSARQAAMKAYETLEHLGLAHLAERITHRLSGGEKRLVSLAAVLAMEPEVLLLDEPTNGVDDQHLARLTEILDSLSIAMIIVCHHRPFLERMAQRAVLLADGHLTPTTFHRHPHAHDHLHIHGLEDDDHQHHADGHHS